MKGLPKESELLVDISLVLVCMRCCRDLGSGGQIPGQEGHNDRHSLLDGT